MTRSEFIIQAVLALNRGHSDTINDRVNSAMSQYNQLVKNGVKFDEENQ